MQHPSLSINLRIIENNTRTLLGLCRDKGVIPVGVSRLVEVSEPIARAMMLGGIQTVGDTQMINLKKMAGLPLRKMLLRRPQLAEVDDVLCHADISLHSEREVLEALSRAAVKADKCHEVIIVHDLDYMRAEGLDDSDTESLAELVLTLPGLVLVGISSHLACYSEVESPYPDKSVAWAGCRCLEANYGNGVAGGLLMMPGKGAPHLNQLRSGRSSIMGIGLNNALIPGTPQSAMSLKAELVEIKEKSSVYAYSVHAGKFNDELRFNDRGIRLRALCAIGKQHIDIDQLTPADDGIMIIGATDNRLILDITDANNSYQVGDSICFYLSYPGVIQCMVSESVTKHYHY